MTSSSSSTSVRLRLSVLAALGAWWIVFAPGKLEAGCDRHLGPANPAVAATLGFDVLDLSTPRGPESPAAPLRTCDGPSCSGRPETPSPAVSVQAKICEHWGRFTARFVLETVVAVFEPVEPSVFAPAPDVADVFHPPRPR